MGARAYSAARFVEKPPLAKARDYLAAGNYVWNAGMFAFTPHTILAALDRHAPAVAASARTVWQPLSARPDDAMLEIDAASFADAPEVSIDYAVMEKAAADGMVAVVRGEFDWSDVGSWQAISELSDADADGNRGSGERVAIDTRGTFVHSEDRVVATIGVENLVIVDTPDAVLIAHRDHLQRVREVVGELKARGHDSYRLHKTVAGHGARTRCCEEGPGFEIERIEVKPGGIAVAAIASSAQRALGRRARHGAGHLGRNVFDLPNGESTFIPVETMHRLENRGTDRSRDHRSRVRRPTSKRTTSSATTTSTAACRADATSPTQLGPAHERDRERVIRAGQRTASPLACPRRGVHLPMPSPPISSSGPARPASTTLVRNFREALSHAAPREPAPTKPDRAVALCAAIAAASAWMYVGIERSLRDLRAQGLPALLDAKTKSLEVFIAERQADGDDGRVTRGLPR